MTPSLSVVIPAYRSATTLSRVLEGLQQQPSDDFEVLVIDDGSPEEDSHELFQATEEYRRRCPGRSIHYAFLGPVTNQFRAGLARNYGASFAKAPRVLFLDSDCVPGPTVVAGHTTYADQPVVVAGAHQQLPYISAGAGEFWRILSVTAPEPDPRLKCYAAIRRRTSASRAFDTHFWPAFWSCQVSVPRERFAALGGFWEAIDGYGSEDQELAWRMQQAGCRLRIDFHLHVWHIGKPSRLSGGQARKRRDEIMARSQREPLKRPSQFL